MRAHWVIPGPPATQGSMTSYGRGRMAHPPKLVAWRALAIATINADQAVFDGPVHVTLRATYRRPASHLRADGTARPAHAGKVPRGDLDKVCRAAGDALEAAGVIDDDNLIVRWTATKQWASSGQPECVVIQVETEMESD